MTRYYIAGALVLAAILLVGDSWTSIILAAACVIAALVLVLTPGRRRHGKA